LDFEVFDEAPTEMGSRAAGTVARPTKPLKTERFVGSATHRRRSGYGAQEAAPTKKTAGPFAPACPSRGCCRGQVRETLFVVRVLIPPKAEDI